MDIQLTSHQQRAFDRIKAWASNGQSDIFVLKGYAGTGKTTLVRFLLDFLEEKQLLEPVLLATTGRAARILASKSEAEAFTVHSHIYGFDVLEEGQKRKGEDTGQLTLNFSLKTCEKKTDKRFLFVVDEASMLSHLVNDGPTVAKFGTGNVLKDLFTFAAGHKILFVGDPAQLSPVAKSAFSPALDANFLQSFFKKTAQQVELTEIMRQAEDHAILSLATQLRKVIVKKESPDWEQVMAFEAPGIYRQKVQKYLIERYLKLVGPKWDQAIILCHSNKQAFFLNNNIRQAIFQKTPPHHLQVGELLMVAQNSYHVPLSNGDQVLVKKVSPGGRRAGLFFLDVEVMSVHDGQLHQTKLIHDFLFRPEPNLDPDKQRNLLIDFDKRARDRGWRRNSDIYKRSMREDPFLNALRAKFGYSVTCHKAQGGEWPTVFINLSKTLNMLTLETRFRWLYTAVTRAQQSLNLKPVWKGGPPKRRRF